MDRRNFLKWSGLASIAVLVKPQYGMAKPPYSTNSFASQAHRGESIEAGWLDSPEVARYFVENNTNPYLSQVNEDIRGTGKGKVALLWPYLEQVTGKSLVPHMQETGDCFIEGTQVTMADGSQKAIQDVSINELVISHLGQPRRVLRTIKKPYSGELITTSCTGYAFSITATPDHQFLTRQNKWQSIKNLDSELLVPTYNLPVQKTLYDITKYIKAGYIIDGDTVRRYPNSQNRVNRYIKLNADLGWLLGIYLAEGGIDGKSSPRITFSLNRAETDIADRIRFLMYKLFGATITESRCKSKPNVLLVRCSNSMVAQFFKSLIPGNVYSKKIPTEVFYAPKATKLACIKGWLDGDGCLEYKTRKNDNNWYLRCTGRTSSQTLAQGMFQLQTLCGLTPRLNSQDQFGRKRAYSLTIYGNQVETIYPNVCDEGRHIKVQTLRRNKLKNSLAFKIKTKINQTVKDIQVYCLEVEQDQSFIANGFAVHNCVSHASGLGVDILTAIQIIKRKSPQRWVAPAATEIIYAGGRIEIAKKSYGQTWRAGMTGTVAAEFVKRYGVLLRQKYLKWDFTDYSGQVADQLGRTGVPDELEPLCRLHPVGNVALVRSYDEARDCIYNGYPVVLCSSQGFNTRGGRDKDGFLAPSRNPWMHSMLLAGIDDAYTRPGGLVQNSWGSSWIDGPKRHNQPDGSFWADSSVIDRICRQGDTIALSCYAGYPRQSYNLW